jgi:D-alanine-D-alanine ligase
MQERQATVDGKAYLLEANPNPQISRDEDFAQSAKHVGIDYEELIQRLLGYGMSYAALQPLK